MKRETPMTIVAGRLLTAQQVADRLLLSLRTVRRMIASGQLPVHRLGRAVRVNARDVEILLFESRCHRDI